MWTHHRSALLRYSIVPVVVVLALLTRSLLLGQEMPFLLLWPGVIVCAWFGGLGPGLFATCVSALVTACLFFEPPHWFSLTKPEDWWGMALFVLLGSALSILCEMLRRAEQKVEQYAQDLQQRAKLLQRSNRELEQFASVAAHDLQEPLRKVQSFGDRLKSKFEGVLGAQGRDYVERMQGSAARMRTLINDLLTFSRVTTKRQPFQPVDLRQVAQEVVSDLESCIHQTGGRVEVGSLPTVDADPLQMRQLLQNLLGNGLKFHRADEPPIVKVEGKVLAGMDRPFNGDGRSDPLCQVSVQDNGIGFEQIYLDRIFEVFQRLHSRQEYEGTGMGLAICRKIVERHSGSLTAQSTPGKGATFIVMLPVRQPKEETHHEKAVGAHHDPYGR